MADIRHLLKTLGSFVVPREYSLRNLRHKHLKAKVVAIIPTYRPSQSTFQLVVDLIAWNPRLSVLVVNDCSPLESDVYLNKLIGLTHITSQIEIIRTPQNVLKAGALNYGLEYLKTMKEKPRVVLTFDDDIIIDKIAIGQMVETLLKNDKLGAVCSQVRVKNKNKNLLTRLQALEYYNFNIVKLAEYGFIRGPLVMQGMLSGFQYRALEEAKGFSAECLIEDYHITAKLKKLGWEVGVAPKAVAWTYVPETFPHLWKQRVRWTYGGLTVLRDFYNYLPAIFQDIIGHALFLAALVTIVLSFLLPAEGVNSGLVKIVVLTALAQFVIGFSFNVYMLTANPDTDRKDWLVRLAIIPELVYSNALSLVMLGSYLFFIYRTLSAKLLKRLPAYGIINSTGLRLFGAFGYTTGWGTR
ncbi:glycosyltransferase family 2 protein [Patescibacteria group bacterium]|nr:glycosyltransferase family 2 protein [Patescibacteria group bacterium]